MRSVSAVKDRRAPQPHVLSEELFDDVLVRERRRADRFEEPFVLFLVTFQGPRSQDGWTSLADALSHAIHDTDVIGWFREGSIPAELTCFHPSR